MEKYGTYDVYKNKQTGEIKRVPVQGETSIEKIGEDESLWEKLDNDPEEE